MRLAQLQLLEGKVAVVTGGSTGLGRAICLRYAANGAKVVIADVRPDEGNETARLVADMGGEAVFVATDVTRADDVKAAVRFAEDRFGGLHIMTANAGVMGRANRRTIIDAPDDDMEFVMSVNFVGVWNSLKYSIAAIRSAGQGAITVTSSTAAHEGQATLPAYSASKAAVLGLIRSVAADIGPVIRVNGVSAGSMHTEIAAHTAELRGIDARNVSFEVPAHKRVVDPDEVARVHLFLASDLAVNINGQTIIVDGGLVNLPCE